MAREAHAERARRKGSLEEKQPSAFPSLPGPQSRGRVEPREALLRGRSLAPLHSLQGSKPFFNIGILAGKRALSNRYESLYKALSFPNSCVAAEMAVVRRLAGPNRIMKTRLVAAYSLTKESCIAVYLYAKYAKAVKRLYRKED
ncbi:hypothetical protein L1987_89389 [Smallanthus sonchifolius]|nr:hypothetical protein L1987_89389 [Smallanthus sonchifolius]